MFASQKEFARRKRMLKSFPSFHNWLKQQKLSISEKSWFEEGFDDTVKIVNRVKFKKALNSRMYTITGSLRKGLEPSFVRFKHNQQQMYGKLNYFIVASSGSSSQEIFAYIKMYCNLCHNKTTNNHFVKLPATTKDIYKLIKDLDWTVATCEIDNVLTFIE